MKLQTQFSCRQLAFFPFFVRAWIGGFQSTATRESLGTVSLSSSSRLPLNVGTILVIPVTFPPGCARLSTNPASTEDQPATRITIGIVLVASLQQWISSAPLATNDIHFQTDHLGSECGKSLAFPLRRPVLNSIFLPFDITKFVARRILAKRLKSRTGRRSSYAPIRGIFRPVAAPRLESKAQRAWRRAREPTSFSFSHEFSPAFLLLTAHYFPLTVT